jgi:hypothetical protein
VRTEDLIARLAAQPAPLRGGTLARRAGLALGAGAAVAAALFAWRLGLRPDIAAALAAPVTAAKTVLPLLAGLLAAGLALAAARPAGQAPATRWAVLGVGGIAAALFAGAFLGTPASERLTVFLGHSIPVCLPSIAALSAPILAGLLVALRRGAPESPLRCGALAGLAAAGTATAIYSLFCTEDSPLFYVAWYGTGIAIVTAAGALAGWRLLRW